MDTRLQLIFAAKNLAGPEIGRLHGQLGRLNGGMGGLAKGGIKSVAGGLVNLAKVGLVGVVAGFAALTGAVGAGIAALKSQAKIDAQTAAVIKSTGGEARVTAKHVGELADAIKDYSGVDDDVIKQGQNMLLTFTGIRNGVGKANQVFDQATKTLIDMSVALGTDPQKQAVALGKALNDPVKGVTALTKVGVTFTDQQKKQIAAMVKSGDTMGAQKVILKELNREFGGSAKAVGDSAEGGWNKLQNAVGDLTKQLASYFMPVFTAIVNFLTTTVVPAVGMVIDRVAAWVSANQPLIRQIGSFIHGVLTTLISVVGNVVGAISGGGKGGGPGLIGTVVELGSKILNYVVPKVQAFIDNLVKPGGVVESIGKVVGPILEKLIPAFGSVVDALFGEGGLVPKLGDLIGVLWGNGKGPLATAISAIGNAFSFAMNNFIVPAINILKGAVDALNAAYRKAVEGANWLSGHDTGKTHFEYGEGIGPSLGAGKNARGGPMWPGIPFSYAENGSTESMMMPSGRGYVLPDGGFSARQASGGSDGGIPPHTHPIYLDGQRVDRMLDRRGYYDLGTQAPTLSRA